jgi:hypothetical protein
MGNFIWYQCDITSDDIVQSNIVQSDDKVMTDEERRDIAARRIKWTDTLSQRPPLKVHLSHKGIDKNDKMYTQYIKDLQS